MATTDDLVALGFTSSSVAVVTLNLPHPDPFGMGPFCRLRVQTTAPQKPGVYAWVADGQVRYVGKAVEDFGLVQKVKGQSLGRAYDDYTYCPPSKALKKSQTRAHVNGLLNGSLAAGHVVEWWWLVAARPGEVEELLIQRWDPPLEHPLAQAAMRVFELVVRIDSPDWRRFDEPRRGAVCGLIGRNTAWLAKSVGIRRGGAPCTRHTSPHRDSGC